LFGKSNLYELQLCIYRIKENLLETRFDASNLSKVHQNISEAYQNIHKITASDRILYYYYYCEFHGKGFEDIDLDKKGLLF
jgi:hypothetical protein